MVNFKLYDNAGVMTEEGSATAINISKTGMLLQTQVPLIPNLKLDVIMNFPAGTVHLKCQCMYCNDVGKSSFESGIHLLKINKKDINTYLGFILAAEKTSTTSKSLRPQSNEITDVVKRISAEHKIINRYVIVLANMMELPSSGPMEVGALIQLMKLDIATHFKIEETMFFNVALSVLPDTCSQIVSELSADHREITQEIDSLIERVHYQVKNGGPLTPPLKERIRELLETIKRHARLELQGLFPLIEENPEAKKRVLEKIRAITKK